jgi:hypothetical protein
MRFTEISRACEHLIAGWTKSGAPEYYVMAAGIVTMYGRPFTNNARHWNDKLQFGAH